VFLIDLSGTIRSWNPGVQKVLGYEESEFVGLDFSVLFTPEDVAHERPSQELGRALSEGRSDDKREHLRKDGSRFRADGVVTVVRDRSGAPRAFSKVMHDVTDEHLRAETLRDSEERYRLLVESVRDYAIFWLDPQGRVASWNAGAERMTGYRVEEILGHAVAVFFTPEDQQRGQVEQELRTAVATGRSENEGWRVRKDGSRFWGNEILTPIREASGELRGFAKVIRDLTERQRAALEREQLYTQAEAANRAKDEFLGTLSHELRTPLNAILGWTHLLTRSEPTPDEAQLRRALEIIKRNAILQTQLVNDLLDVSRIISGKMRLDIRSIPLSDALGAAVDAAQPAARAIGVALQCTVEPDVDDTIAADPDRFQQIVWNLVSNAIKFTSASGHVRVEAHRGVARTDLIVEDTGVGIAADLLPFVFDRFRQADSSTTRHHGGVGLGLAIVRHLVELHGGRVEATSGGLGHGARFTVHWPANTTAGERVGPSLERRSQRSASRPTFTSVRVLVVDDDADTREIVRTVLGDVGAQVIAAASAAEGLTLLDEHVPDVIIADVGMPGEDGYAFIQRVRARLSPRGIQPPAIALTAYAGAADRERALAAGFQRHVPKPFDPGTLTLAVAELVSAPS
jgi:PAS domain S-box-containing protein